MDGMKNIERTKDRSDCSSWNQSKMTVIKPSAWKAMDLDEDQAPLALLGLKFTCRGLPRTKNTLHDNFESDRDVEDSNEVQIPELDEIHEACDKKKRKSYVCTGSNSDSFDNSESKQCVGSSVSHSMGSKYNEGHLLSACMHYSDADDNDGQGETCRINKEKVDEKFREKMDSNFGGNSKTSRGMMEGQLRSSQQGLQRYLRLQTIPPLPLFSPLQPDPSMPISSRVEDMVHEKERSSGSSIDSSNPSKHSSQSYSLNDTNYNGRSSPPNHSNGAELLQISDEEMLNFPKHFTDAFNIGDYEGLSKIIIRCIAEDCALKTPALENDLIGRHHVISVMFALLDDHPDAIMMWKDTKYLPQECILKSKHYFSGTKALHSTHTHLYQKVSGSLVNQVDLSRYTADEILQLEELEKSIIQKGSPFLVFAKGTLRLSINRANMISRFLWDWKVTSFREFVDTSKVLKT